MSDKPEYIYIMYPVKMDKLKDFNLPLFNQSNTFISPKEDEDFVPLWYQHAKFPEDED